jgi:hypothetical protein
LSAGPIGLNRNPAKELLDAKALTQNFFDAKALTQNFFDAKALTQKLWK